MPSIIRVLDEMTINQIAAGEVIENPSSVVKELIENSIDAEATSISIEISASGRHFIRVLDNGLGMNKDDALLCFERHATSKVSKMEDFDRLSSMGFRGEALPSIASVAKVRLLTRPKDHEKGTLVEIHGGKVLTCTSIPCEVGTSIEVAELFYNVPARKKFLKSIRQDFSEIQKMVIQIAYANPLIQFSLVSDKEAVLDISLVSNYFERAKQLLQESIYDHMVPIDFNERAIKIEGLIGEPSLHRPNRTGQALFINQRPVSSWEVSQAILEGYGSSLPERRYPLFHIFLTMPPQEFDVNVHPQKKEVRFSHLGNLKEILQKGVSQTLNQSMHQSVDIEPILKEFTYEMPSSISWSASEPPSESYLKKEVAIPLPLKPAIPSILGIFLYYIILEDSAGIQLLDIQRAQKRIFYEEFLSKKKVPEKQLLLVPLKIQFSEEESAFLKEFNTQLEFMGFLMRPSENSAFFVESIPSFLKEKEVETVLAELTHTRELNHWAEWLVQKVEKEKRILLKFEAELLVERLFSCQQPYFTPSGQSIFARITYDDIGRFFK